MNGAPIVGAVQLTTIFVPMLVVFGVPGADGTTIIVIVAPCPIPDGLDIV
jgi:hypothetical protein